MKQIVFAFLLSMVFVPWLFGENQELSPDLTKIRIKESPDETLEYVGKIGSDFDSALDSLRKLKGISSDIIKKPLEVLYDYDNRLFYGIAYGDCLMYSDVLDTKGNYYLRLWYGINDSNTNVVTAPHTFISEGKSSNLQPFDLSGRRIAIPHAKGVFIKDGKKNLKKCER